MHWKRLLSRAALALAPLAITTGCVVLEPVPAPAPVTPASPDASTNTTGTGTAPNTPATAEAHATPGKDSPMQVTPPQPGASKAAARASAGPVSLEILPQFDPIQAGAETELNVLLRLTAAGAAPTARPPLDLAIVLDRSGSMAGQKLLDAKQAALDLIKQLEPTDRVTLVVYDDKVQVLENRRHADPAGQDALRGALLQVREGGSTALGPAMIKALEILEPAERGEKDIAHVMLLSDGLANVGEARPDVLGSRCAQGFARGVSVSTLGVGLDYNEDLMTKLADQGGGRYHYIKDSNTIPGVLTEELAGLAATVARGLVLTLEPASQGVSMPHVFGYPVTNEGGKAVVRVGAMRAGQTREIVARMTLPATAAGKLEVAKVGLRFRDVSRDGQELTAALPLVVGVTGDEPLVRREERTEVTVRVAEVESAEQLEAAARAVEKGDYNNARQIIQGTIVNMQGKASATKSERLQKQLKELEEAQADVDKAESSPMEQKEYTKAQKAKAYKTRK